MTKQVKDIAAIATATTTAAKKKKVDAENTIIANLEKQMGIKDPKKFIIKKFGDIKNSYHQLAVISFGDLKVDAASNCGGIPRGKMVEIFGPESGGKSLLTLRLIASAQKMGLKCCLVDVEQSFDPKWAALQGVDTDNLYIIDENLSAERILDYVVAICESGEFGLVVVDSTAALIPEKELEGSVSDQDYALLARAMSKACKKIAGQCGATDTTCIFINQIREKMGVTFGDKTTTPGGKSLKFYSHQRIRVTPGETIKVKEGDKMVVVARKSYVKFVKNKVARPFGECIMEIVFDASALNPVVKLCNIGKATEFKAIAVRDGEFTINKDIVEAKKNLPTGTNTMVDLAKYIVRENLVVKIIEYINSIKEENPEIETKLSEDILVMLTDPAKIIPPDADGLVLSGTLITDGTGASTDDIRSEEGEEPTDE